MSSAKRPIKKNMTYDMSEGCASALQALSFVGGCMTLLLGFLFIAGSFGSVCHCAVAQFDPGVFGTGLFGLILSAACFWFHRELCKPKWE